MEVLGKCWIVVLREQGTKTLVDFVTKFTKFSCWSVRIGVCY